jgi:inorganic pyrophosphatase
MNHIRDVSELPKHFIDVLKNYFENYKVLENKVVEIDEFQDKDAAYKIINEAIEYYKEKYPR